MNTTRFIVSTAACAALTTSASAVTLTLPIGQTIDIDDPSVLLQDPEGGGLAFVNGTTGEGIGVGSAPPTFLETDIGDIFGSGVPLAVQFLISADDVDDGGIVDVTTVVNDLYISQIHASETCVFDESLLIDDSGAPYPGKVAFQNLTPGEHFFNFRVTRLADGEQHFGFMKYETNPDSSMYAISAAFNTTAGEPAACPDGLGLVPAALGMGLVMLRHARSRRAMVADV